MLEMLKKTYLAGADLAHKTWDEVEALSKELVKKAKMSENEGSKFLQDMKKRYDDTQKKTGTYIEKAVKDILKKMDIATAADIKALKKEIRQLKKATATTTVKKPVRKTAAKKRTLTAAKKRTATAAKKRKTTATKKRTATAAKKTSGRAKPKTRARTTKTRK
ncbi:MAG: phasin family protein [Desulfobacterales bacterium]|jgi:polyhydroxyalkanoate synthesis regulator phasin